MTADDTRQDSTGNNQQVGVIPPADPHGAAPGDTVGQMAQYSGLDHTADAVRGQELQEENQYAVNYLVHRMLWGQEEKIDNVTVTKDGHVRVNDEVW